MSRKAHPVDTSTYPGKFAANLRNLRHTAGLTVDQITEMLAEMDYSLASRSYYQWECGRSEPEFSVLPLLAAIFGLSGPHELFVLPDDEIEQAAAEAKSAAIRTRAVALAQSHLDRLAESAKKMRHLAEAVAAEADCVVIPRDEYKRLLAASKKRKS